MPSSFPHIRHTHANPLTPTDYWNPTQTLPGPNFLSINHFPLSTFLCLPLSSPSGKFGREKGKENQKLKRLFVQIHPQNPTQLSHWLWLRNTRVGGEELRTTSIHCSQSKLKKKKNLKIKFSLSKKWWGRKESKSKEIHGGGKFRHWLSAPLPGN